MSPIKRPHSLPRFIFAVLLLPFGLHAAVLTSPSPPSEVATEAPTATLRSLGNASYRANIVRSEIDSVSEDNELAKTISEAGYRPLTSQAVVLTADGLGTVRTLPIKPVNDDGSSTMRTFVDIKFGTETASFVHELILDGNTPVTQRLVGLNNEGVLEINLKTGQITALSLGSDFLHCFLQNFIRLYSPCSVVDPIVSTLQVIIFQAALGSAEAVSLLVNAVVIQGLANLVCAGVTCAVQGPNAEEQALTDIKNQATRRGYGEIVSGSYHVLSEDAYFVYRSAQFRFTASGGVITGGTVFHATSKQNASIRFVATSDRDLSWSGWIQVR